MPTNTGGELRKPRMLMQAKHSLDRLQTRKASGVHGLMGSITAQPAKEKRGERWNARRAAQSRAFYPFVTACRAFKVRADILDRVDMFIVILWRTRSLYLLTCTLTNVWSEYGRSYSICPKV
jgi:hypothetical protein